MEGAVSGSAGLFTGSRSTGDLLLGLRGEEMTRMNPSESFARYMQQVAGLASRNEWRVGAERKWVNTARKLQKQGKLGKTKVRGFNDTEFTPDTPEKKALQALRDQLNTWNGISTKEEGLFNRWVQQMHDWALNGVNTALKTDISRLPGLGLKTLSPINRIKSTNMHLFLGVLNPAQLYVQASAATVALSLLKFTDIPRVIGNATAWHILDVVGDTKVRGAMYKAMQADKIVSAADEDLYNLWLRTGYKDSIRSNADINFAETTGLGITTAALGKAENVSLSIYRGGEIINRRLSFMSAAQRWQDKTKKAWSKVTDDDLSDILTEANKTMLELNGANKAWRQGGKGKGEVRQT